ncbi:MAG: DUF11 domain-containing protein [Clostridia bacterium]|nr:DUF11 domain-containing protein [Clostridia bacterium]
MLGNYSYSTGNVSVDETIDGVKQDDFNVTCALLYTTNLGSGDANWNNVSALYNKEYQKALFSTGTVQTESATNVLGFTDEDFKNGTACASLSGNSSDTLWINVSGLNSGYPISKALNDAKLFSPETYYLENSSLDFSVKNGGYVSFNITPVGNEATVSLGLDERVVQNKRNYSFYLTSVSNTLSVQGKAYVTKSLMGQTSARDISELTSTPIKVSFPDNKPRSVMIGLYKDKVLKEFKYFSEVAPVVLDGKSTVSAIINLTDVDITDCTLKAYLWEPDSALPVREVAILGRNDASPATTEEKELAISEVAKSYFLRGSSVQFDSEALNTSGLSFAEKGAKTPEDYTNQAIGYTDNTAFCYDVYKEALGVALPDTFEDIVNSEYKVLEESTQDIDASKLETSLSCGDLVALEGGTANHLMVYAGDGEFVHAVGESYDFDAQKDSYEDDGAIKKLTLSEIFSQNSSFYALNYDKMSVIRPAKAENLVLPKETENRINNMQGIIAKKTSSHNFALPVQPGEKVTFTFTLENTNDTEKTVYIKDTVPAYTTLLSGCDDANGLNLSWKVTLGAGETKTVSYRVLVTSDKEKCGEYVTSYSTVGGVPVNCPRILIGRVLSETDEKRISTAMHAMSDSEFENFTLAKSIYLVGLTKSFVLPNTPTEILDSVFLTGNSSSSGTGASGEEVADSATDLVKITIPSMFGGRKVSENAEKIFDVSRARRIDSEDIITGDILVAQNDLNDESTAKMYMYNGTYMFELAFKGMKKYETKPLLEALPSFDRYLILRPSLAILNLNNFEEEVDENLTPEQDAVVSTAKAYLLRGSRMQYDDTGFTPTVEYRWQKKLKHPEDYTKDEWGYSNCAAFTYDVYYHSLGFDIVMYTTDMLKADNQKMTVYFFEKTGNETDAQKATVRSEILNTLKAGDIIVVKRESGSGHAMLYAGNGTIIHSGGSNYNYNTSTETYEPTVRFKNVEDLFTENDTCNPFGIVSYFGILRPLNKWTNGIPENTQNRVANLKGIRAEKISSHKSSVTVNPGDEMTFTFSVYNSNETAVTLDVTDTVPENATYVSGADKVDENALSWKVNVAPYETKEISYKIRVNEDAEIGSYVKCDMGKVGGVAVKCPNVLIKKTLTSSQQQTLKTSIDKFIADSTSTLTYVDLANAIYKDAFGVENILPDTDASGTFELTDIETGVYTATTSPANLFKVNPDGAYFDLIAPTLYGGRKFYQTSVVPTRTRLARPHHLVCGDILLAKSLSATYLYIYDGEKYYNLSSKLESSAAKRMENILAYGNYYVVLRPSFVME